VFFAAVLAPGMAWACPGKGATADAASAEEGTTVATAKAQSDAQLDATACAKKASLVGAACSYSTGMMASRVLDQGEAYTFTGTLVPTDEVLTSQVAAPFTAGPDRVRVIANEVVESATRPDSRMTWKGKVLEVDGVQYFVVTSYEKGSA
jgi:hypothetical protein